MPSVDFPASIAYEIRNISSAIDVPGIFYPIRSQQDIVIPVFRVLELNCRLNNCLGNDDMKYAGTDFGAGSGPGVHCE